MAAAGAVVAARAAGGTRGRRTGVSTLALDEIAEAVIRDGGGTPSFLGYHGYPATHLLVGQRASGARNPVGDRDPRRGDLVSIDCGAIVDGWHGDAAITFGVGPLIAVDEALSAATKAVDGGRYRGDGAGNRLGDVSHAIECGTRAAEAGVRPQVRHRRGLRRPRHRQGRCTWTRSYPTRARPGAARCWPRVRCWPSSRC